MDEGLTEEIHAFGHRYQVQTELVGDEARILRTSVFDSGRVIAIRERPLEAGRDVAGALESHHRMVVDGLLERAEGDTGVGPAPSRRREGASHAASTAPPLTQPPVPEDPALVDGLRVRQLFGDFRGRIQQIAAGEESARLEAAEDTVRWIIGHPLFPRIRLDEQLRFHRLLDRITAPGPEPDEASRWREVHELGAYLNLINHRADLVAFDGDLLAWLESSVEARGIDPSTLTPMRWIFGRDGALDILLEEVGTTDRQVWLAEIRRVRSKLAS